VSRQQLHRWFDKGLVSPNVAGTRWFWSTRQAAVAFLVHMLLAEGMPAGLVGAASLCATRLPSWDEQLLSILPDEVTVWRVEEAGEALVWAVAAGCVMPRFVSLGLVEKRAKAVLKEAA